MTVPPTFDLPSSSLFRAHTEHDSVTVRINIAHKRAKAIGVAHALSAQDILHLSHKFWDMHLDLITTLDGAAVTLLTIQLNLAAGTLAPYAAERPDLRPLLESILSFDVSAQFLLTEVGHGLDAIHIETTARLCEDGGFDLHTPSNQAAKHMPPTLPMRGVPAIGIVFARLLANGNDHGIRPFIVSLNDGHEMCEGVRAFELPTRCGSKPVGHALTYFDHVHLPPAALLGDLNIPKDPRKHFLRTIWRVGIGSISLTAVVISGLKIAACIVAMYSSRRLIGGVGGHTVPIIMFRTQQIPILHALAQAFVLQALYEELTRRISLLHADDCDLRNALATVFKVVAIQNWRRTIPLLADRCGAQGLFEHNQIIPMEMELRGVTIAEGDMLALSIRLASEIVLGRYSLPTARDTSSYLARHEAGLLEECRLSLRELGGSHRDQAYSNLLLPRALSIVEAVGHRMAFEAAVAAKVKKELIDLYEAVAIQSDLAWYIECSGLTRRGHTEVENMALTAVYQNMGVIFEQCGTAPYVVAAIRDQQAWDNFVCTLKLYRGKAKYDPFIEMKSRL
ncbi:acyl-CoA oxidase [Neolentinus lepideus HHB14362 ss-1]|uniref:Acyl-CoA oxidase n=1 Tax=Neolentinus lepideus HHB14362 ss-1 TaxID=1314782 RepID=A0A165NGH2_9AGAM|nr:acyl-CoA oxidase [Neolentinus lepideus HHB14362 ss-1]